VPLRYSRRNAAVAEAEAKLAGRVAEFEQRRNQVNLQVEEALAQAREAERVVKLYTDTILPAAELNVKAAQSAYTTGKTPFISLIEAQRSRVNLRDRHYEAIADVFRKRASLERAVGGPILQQK
jgi:outer membrane protein TolC